MTKLSRKYLSSDKMGYYINNLWAGFTLMDNKEDIRLLFRDLFTHTEYKMFAKRLEVARRLLDGELYIDIEKQLNVTERTIANISNILAEKGDGFRKVHWKLSEIEKSYREKRVRKTERMSRLQANLPGSKVLPQVLGASLKYATQKFSQHSKRKSAKRMLQV